MLQASFAACIESDLLYWLTYYVEIFIHRVVA